MFIEEIEQCRRLAYIRAGHPATLDLWYPPRYLTPPEYQQELKHTKFLEYSRPNPVQQTVELDLIQQFAEQDLDQLFAELDLGGNVPGTRCV